MARRRIHSIPRPATAFKESEVKAVTKGIAMLYRRSLGHLVAPKFAIPNLPETYKAMVAPVVWETLAEAFRMKYGNVKIDVHDNDDIALANHVRLDVRSGHYLPTWNMLRPDERVMSAWPKVLEDYAAAAYECRQKWTAINDLFVRVNKDEKRSTAVYFWPCVTALMALGGEVYTDGEITRPVPLSGRLTVELRESNAYVMQHMLLPPLEKKPLFEGDFTGHGLGVGLEFTQETTLSGGQKQLWPIGEY